MDFIFKVNEADGERLVSALHPFVMLFNNLQQQAQAQIEAAKPIEKPIKSKRK